MAIVHWAVSVIGGVLLGLAHWVRERSGSCNAERSAYRRHQLPGTGTWEGVPSVARWSERDERVRDVLVRADAVVQAHLTVDLTAGMADLVARRERRAGHIRRSRRRYHLDEGVSADTAGVGMTHDLPPRMRAEPLLPRDAVHAGTPMAVLLQVRGRWLEDVGARQQPGRGNDGPLPMVERRAAAMPSGVIGSHGYRLASARTGRRAAVVCVDLDRADPALDVALHRARPWRRLDRSGTVYSARRVDDPRGADRTCL